MPLSPGLRFLSVLCGVAAVLLPSLAANAGDAATALPAGSYKIDKFHSTLVFRANHLGFSYYKRVLC